MRYSGGRAAIVAGTAGFLLGIGGAAASDMGQAAADQVSLDSFQEYMQDWLFCSIGNNRGPAGTAHDPARDNIATLFASYGLTVAIEPFNHAGYECENVVATKTGTVHPDRVFILGAHYDSFNNPGADDDASGVALVLEAARILSAYDSEYTIRFVAFDMAEQGLGGSQAYAAAHAGDRVLGMISANMVAYNPSGSQALVLGNLCSDPLKAALSNALTAYSGGLTGSLSTNAAVDDYQSFRDSGARACRLAEYSVFSNPYNHLQSDYLTQPGNINFPYALQMVRAVVGLTVDQAGVSGLSFSFPDGRPELIDPSGGTRVRVEVSAGAMTPQAETAFLQYDAGGGFVSVPLEIIAPQVYDAVFPVVTCGTDVAYRFTVQTTGGLVMTSPAAGAETYRALAANSAMPRFTDDFETDLGWTESGVVVDGRWERGVPVGLGQRGDPPLDGDRSGTCYLTKNLLGNSDVDGGTTMLTSPIIDAGDSDAWIRYWLWYTNCYGAAPNNDLFVILVSNDAGENWTTVETVGPVSATGWVGRRFRLGQYVTPTEQVRVQFRASDLSSESVVEAGLDGFEAWSFGCGGGCPGADGDINDDGLTDGRDVRGFIEAVLGSPDSETICHGDFTGDGLLTAADIPGLVEVLLAG